jgi:acyl carrier protein
MLRKAGKHGLMTQEQFLGLLTDWIRTNKQTSEDLKMSMETELLGSGLLDSFDFLDLIVYIESKSGRKIDLAMADPNEFSIVRGLWNLAAQSEKPSHDNDRKSTFPANAGLTG